MAQIHAPIAAPKLAPKPAAGRATAQSQFSWWVDVAVVLALVALITGVIAAATRWTAPATPTAHVTLAPSALPLYAGLSTLRMALAYVISLVFSLAYARLAVASRAAERVMLPILDILQSVPILSFLPAVVLALVALFPHSNIGLELAAILLIFTSQAWNMAFSFHSSLMTVPKELREAAAIYRLNVWQRFTRMELPFGTIPLIWNSMMSWAGGWFFLMAAEQFTLGDRSFQLPGLGSYLQTAANAGNLGALGLGMLTLIVVIVLLDQLLWRPLIAWADRFKFEQTSGAEAPKSWVLDALRRSALLSWWRAQVWRRASERLDRLGRPVPLANASPKPATSTAKPATQRVVVWRALRPVLALVALAGVVWGMVGALGLLRQVSPGDWGTVVVSTGATLLRTTAALVIAVAWTVPVGVTIGLHPAWARRLQPLVQMVASIPATALFPALLLLLISLPGGLNLAAVALMLLGTQWYVLFNVIAGAMAIPSDLREAGTVYKLRGWRRWRTLILPAIFPALVTGMITATGGAWNASIVAEYVTFNNHTFATVGLGALIAQAAGSRQFGLLLAATLAMAVTVVLINRLVWRRLYRLAEQRFRLD